MPPLSFRLWMACALLAVLGLTPTTLPYAHAQSSDDIPSVTQTYAIVGARVVQAPGRVLEQATVVVRDGLILSVDPSAVIPFDAKRIEGDSLTVYAGFIDAFSTVGIPKPKEDQNPERVDDPGNPPNDRAGIQPDRDARDLLKADDKSVSALREAGFGAAHTVPHGRMLPGSGAVILLAGDDPNAMVLKGGVSMAAQFAGGRGVYPNTPMAISAKMRQLYREAARRQGLVRMYEQNPAGLERPAYDAVHYAFFPIIEGQRPVYFAVEDALETYRALSLQRTLGFKMVLTGVAQGFDALEALKTAQNPLVLTLDLPEAPKSTAKLKEDSVAALIASYDPEFRTGTFRDLEAEQRNLEARQLISRKQYLSNAAELHQAGLSFSFSTADVKPGEIHENLRLMIQHGLPEDVALAALTTTPAQLLGLSQTLGTVEPGKIANLVVTTAPYFDEAAKIKYVFVDGTPHEYEAKEKKAAADGAPVNALGTWSYTVETPQGAISGTIVLTGSPDDLEGTISNDMSPEATDIEGAALDGNEVSFSFSNPQMGTLTVTFTITGDEIEGTIEVPGMGGFPISGSRTSDPD